MTQRKQVAKNTLRKAAGVRGLPLGDVQSQRDARKIALHQVGVCDLRYPIRVLDRANKEQRTVGTFRLTVSLPHEFRGAHLSRFVEALTQHHENIGVGEIQGLLVDIKKRLKSEESHLEVSFPYFIERAAPATGARAMVEYGGGFDARFSKKLDFVLVATAFVTTLCPCSKEISDRGAHNQRTEVTIRTRSSSFVWLEDLIEIIESCASSPVFTLLKREDEKAVTESAYDRPRFVEDIVREIALRLNALSKITAYHVTAVSCESIHNHNALAIVKKRWPA